MASPLWTVILAAGAGRRLSGVTGDVPKQFWRGGSSKSLLDQTVERFSPLAAPSQTVIVVDATHRQHLLDAGASRHVGRTLFQPHDRGTAVGVLLALTPVFESSMDAIVAITPADHGVVDDARFRRGVLEAASSARSRDAVVIFGVEPDAPHHDYGWITPGPSCVSSGLRPVVSFVEKPSPDQAARLLAAGSVWNTMVLVGRAPAVRALFVEYLPELTAVLDRTRGLPAIERDTFLTAVYPSLPVADFSRDVITPARNLLTYVWPASLGWSDLGTPERLHDWQMQASARGGANRVTTAA